MSGRNKEVRQFISELERKGWVVLRNQMPLTPSPELEELERKIAEMHEELVGGWVRHAYEKLVVIPQLCGPFGRVMP
jgi:hypothetical protein